MSTFGSERPPLRQDYLEHGGQCPGSAAHTAGGPGEHGAPGTARGRQRRLLGLAAGTASYGGPGNEGSEGKLGDVWADGKKCGASELPESGPRPPRQVWRDANVFRVLLGQGFVTSVVIGKRNYSVSWRDNVEGLSHCNSNCRWHLQF